MCVCVRVCMYACMSRKLALGACDRELELPRQPAKLPGGSLRGGWSTGPLLRNRAIAFGEGSFSGPLFGALRGPRRAAPGGARRAPGSAVQRAQRAFSGSAGSASRAFSAARTVLFPLSSSRSLSLSLSLSLSPCTVSLRSPLLMRGARCCASRSIKARAPRAGNENSGIAAREEAARCSSHPGVWGPSQEELPLHAPQVVSRKP